MNNLDKIRAFLSTLTGAGAEADPPMPNGDGMRGYIRWENVGSQGVLRVYVDYTDYRGQLRIGQIRIMAPLKPAVYLPYHSEPEELVAVIREIVDGLYVDESLKDIVDLL